MSNSLQPHRLQHAKILYPSLSPSVCSNSCLVSQWRFLTISSQPSLFAFNLAQHQGHFQWVCSWHQMTPMLDDNQCHSLCLWRMPTGIWKKSQRIKYAIIKKKKKTNENSISTVQKEISLFSVAQVHRLAFRCSVQCPGIKQSFQFHIWRSHTACLWLTATSMKCLSGPFPCSRKCSVCLLWILWDQTQRVWHQRTGLNRAWNLGHCEDGERGELDTSADNLISLIN